MQPLKKSGLTFGDRLCSAILASLVVGAFLVFMGGAGSRRALRGLYSVDFWHWTGAVCCSAFVLGFLFGPEPLMGMVGRLSGTDKSAGVGSLLFFLLLILSGIFAWYFLP